MFRTFLDSYLETYHFPFKLQYLIAIDHKIVVCVSGGCLQLRPRDWFVRRHSCFFARLQFIWKASQKQVFSKHTLGSQQDIFLPFAFFVRRNARHFSVIDHYLLFLRVHSEWLNQIKKITLKTYRDEGTLEVSVVGYQQGNVLCCLAMCFCLSTC